MSDINLDFTVSNNSIQFTVEPNEITITPTDIQLTLGSTGGAAPAGNVGQLQYKVSGLQFGGVPNTSYDGSNLSLGDVSNVKIGGGTNGYVLQTDGTGNLGWTVQTGGGGGNGAPGGSNTQVQFNDAGTFGGNVGFTFNKTSGLVTMAGNVATGNLSSTGSVSASTLTGSLTTPNQSNITTIGTLGSLNVAGTISIEEAKEKVNIEGAISGAYNFDVLNGSIQYSTANSIANVSLNFRGDSGTTLNSVLNTGQSITATFLMTNGSSAAYDVTSVQVDGVTQTVKFGSSVTPVLNSIVAFTYTIIKLGTNTYTVLGSESRYI